MSDFENKLPICHRSLIQFVNSILHRTRSTSVSFVINYLTLIVVKFKNMPFFSYFMGTRILTDMPDEYLTSFISDDVKFPLTFTLILVSSVAIVSIADIFRSDIGSLIGFKSFTIFLLLFKSWVKQESTYKVSFWFRELQEIQDIFIEQFTQYFTLELNINLLADLLVCQSLTHSFFTENVILNIQKQSNFNAHITRLYTYMRDVYCAH